MNDTDLAGAVISITSSAAYPDGSSDESQGIRLPLQTTVYNDYTHLAIRNSAGEHVESLTSSGPNDILLDMWILGQFIRAGDWTFEFAAELEGGRNLFSLKLTQYLDGGLRFS